MAALQKTGGFATLAVLFDELILPVFSNLHVIHGWMSSELTAAPPHFRTLPRMWDESVLIRHTHTLLYTHTCAHSTALPFPS